MSAMTMLPLRPDGWTVDDLDLIPEDWPFRYELVDGSLLVSPPPPNAHNLVANSLSHLLHPVLDRKWVSLTPGGVEFGRCDWRQPDLLVMARAALSKKYAAPGDALLAVEVMSPSSVGTDRLVKPHQYAAAGIVHFWRFEPVEAVLITHVLDDGVYRETARYTDEVTIDEPVTLRFRVADLLP
ncbi:MAG TPA: Uma2 family endonuclease [Mycobacteriales bacterium]|nr:Uma2 family endonuclease [Mycobacteriales bacterium]